MKDLAFDHWDDLLLRVLTENDRQLGKWGYQDHSAFRWCTFLVEEVGELAASIADSHWDREDITDKDVADEAIQVATLAMKIAEMHLFREQSEAPDLVNPSMEALRKTLQEAGYGEIINIEISPTGGKQ
jgi:NTP pyrophosphatase (non-canonical NTP hydrolase)